MLLSLIQIEVIAEESSPLVQIGLRQVRFYLRNFKTLLLETSVVQVGCGATYPRIKVFSLKIALILHTLKNNTCLALPKTSKQ